MSKLEQLINELCPDGVEYNSLKELCDIVDYRGKTPKKVNQGIFLLTAKNIRFGYIDYKKSQEYISVEDYENVMRRGKPKIGDVLITTEAPCGNVAQIDDENIALAQRVIKYRPKSLFLNSSYLKYILLGNEFQKKLFSAATGGTVKGIKGSELHKIQIPLPPLPIQEEIVRILDTFTELTAELTTELTVRKQQYEYYRNEFFGQNYEEMLKKASEKNITIIPLEKLGKFVRGKRFVRNDIQDSGIPCIHYGDLYTYYGISSLKTKCFLNSELAKKMRFATKNDVVIVQAGESETEIGIGVAWLGEEEVAVHDACYIFSHNINAKYISYFLRTNLYNLQIRKYVSSGKICAITSKGIGKALIPVPPLEEQQRIVDILDRFDALVNDIKEGLPAEIEARQKQYEYYRDKLLTFKKLVKEVKICY